MNSTMDTIRCEVYEVEFVPVKAVPENKSGITFKGNGAGYLEAHRMIQSIARKTGEILIKNGIEMCVIDTPKNKPTKIEIKRKNGVIGKVNLKVYDVNGKGGATMMVQKVSGQDFAHVKTLGIDILKTLIDGVIEGKIQEKDIENLKRKRSQKMCRGSSVNVNRSTEYKKYPCEYCEKGFSTLQGLNLHIGYIHKTEMKFNCNMCKRRFCSKDQLEQHIETSHTISESPNSKKMRLDSKRQNSVKKEDKIVKEIQIQNNEDELMDIDTEEDPISLQKRNDDKVLKKQKLL